MIVVVIGGPVSWLTLAMFAPAIENAAYGLLLLCWLVSYVGGAVAIVLRGRWLVRRQKTAVAAIGWAMLLYLSPVVLISAALHLFTIAIGRLPSRATEPFVLSTLMSLFLFLFVVPAIVRFVRWPLVTGVIACLGVELLMTAFLTHRMFEASPEFQYRSGWDLSIERALATPFTDYTHQIRTRLVIDAMLVMRTEGQFVYQDTCVVRPIRSGFLSSEDRLFWVDLNAYSWDGGPSKPGHYRARITCELPRELQGTIDGTVVLDVQSRSGRPGVLKSLSADFTARPADKNSW